MKPPAHLSKRARRLWNAVARAFDLEPVHEELLLRALEAADRADQAREILDREGLTVAGRDGPRPHPAVQIELTNRRASTTLLRDLRLDEAADASASGRDLARKRWRG